MVRIKLNAPSPEGSRAPQFRDSAMARVPPNPCHKAWTHYPNRAIRRLEKGELEGTLLTSVRGGDNSIHTVVRIRGGDEVRWAIPVALRHDSSNRACEYLSHVPATLPNPFSVRRRRC
jgi:hypothetical protein